MNNIPTDGPVPELIARSSIEWIEAKRHERAEPVARKFGLHTALLRTERISRQHHEWTERYAQETEIMAGARLGAPEIERIDTYQGPQVYHRAAQAATWLRGPHSRLTMRQIRLIHAACVCCYRIGDVAIAIGLHPDDSETLLAFARRVDERIRRYVIRAIIVGSGIKPEY